MARLKALTRVLSFLTLLAFLIGNVWIELQPGIPVGVTAKLIFAGIFVLLWSVVYYAHPGGGSPARRRGYCLALFAYYIWMLLNMLFFDAAFGRGSRPGGLNTTPFLTIHNYLRAYELGNISLKWVLVNLVGNVAAFAPMGFFLPALYPKQRNLLVFAPSIVGMVAAVEILQYLTRTGSCDVDDLILNFAGALAVWIVCLLPPFRGWIRHVTERKGAGEKWKKQ